MNSKPINEVEVLGDATLRLIAQELLKTVRDDVTIDWTVRENVRSRLRVMVKRILRKHGYPPDKQGQATQLVLEQAEVICGEMAGWRYSSNGSFCATSEARRASRWKLLN